jgi:hypothetical protein
MISPAVSGMSIAFRCRNYTTYVVWLHGIFRVLNNKLLEVGETPTLCRNGKPHETNLRFFSSQVGKAESLKRPSLLLFSLNGVDKSDYSNF